MLRQPVNEFRRHNVVNFVESQEWTGRNQKTSRGNKPAGRSSVVREWVARPRQPKSQLLAIVPYASKTIGSLRPAIITSNRSVSSPASLGVRTVSGTT